MTAPRSDIVQMALQNPHASMPLIIPVQVVCNTSDDDLHRNIAANSALDLPWISMVPAHDRVAMLIGGGPSAGDCLDEIRTLARDGATIFAMNGASQWARRNGIHPDHQIIADAKPETAGLVDPGVGSHLLASQVHPDTMAAASGVTLWHLGIEAMEDLFPQKRVARGGYALIGGGAAVGNSALCLAYALGYRTFHLFGYDSSHRDDASHAYDQPMNRFIPVCEVTWAGRKFNASVAMKAQAEKFQITAQALKRAGCVIDVHGDGLLPTMWRTPAADLAERDKYRVLWQFDSYRDHAPGEHAVEQFIEIARPDGLIVDFGCGTGRAGLALATRGFPVMLVDFADNCRDEEAIDLPFLEWDLTRPCPISAPYGLCCDVMEHIPADEVDAVIANIMASAGSVFFQISTVPDSFGAMIGATLHNTVRSHDWWADRFTALGYEIHWQEAEEAASRFFIRNLSERH